MFGGSPPAGDGSRNPPYARTSGPAGGERRREAQPVSPGSSQTEATPATHVCTCLFYAPSLHSTHNLRGIEGLIDATDQFTTDESSLRSVPARDSDSAPKRSCGASAESRRFIGKNPYTALMILSCVSLQVGVGFRSEERRVGTKSRAWG